MPVVRGESPILDMAYRQSSTPEQSPIDYAQVERWLLRKRQRRMDEEKKWKIDLSTLPEKFLDPRVKPLDFEDLYEIFDNPLRRKKNIYDEEDVEDVVDYLRVEGFPVDIDKLGSENKTTSVQSSDDPLSGNCSLSEICDYTNGSPYKSDCDSAIISLLEEPKGILPKEHLMEHNYALLPEMSDKNETQQSDKKSIKDKTRSLSRKSSLNYDNHMTKLSKSAKQTPLVKSSKSNVPMSIVKSPRCSKSTAVVKSSKSDVSTSVVKSSKSDVSTSIVKSSRLVKPPEHDGSTFKSKSREIPKSESLQPKKFKPIEKLPQSKKIEPKIELKTEPAKALPKPTPKLLETEDELLKPDIPKIVMTKKCKAPKSTVVPKVQLVTEKSTQVDKSKVAPAMKKDLLKLEETKATSIKSDKKNSSYPAVKIDLPKLETKATSTRNNYVITKSSYPAVKIDLLKLETKATSTRSDSAILVDKSSSSVAPNKENVTKPVKITQISSPSDNSMKSAIKNPIAKSVDKIVEASSPVLLNDPNAASIHVQSTESIKTAPIANNISMKSSNLENSTSSVDTAKEPITHVAKKNKLSCQEYFMRRGLKENKTNSTESIEIAKPQSTHLSIDEVKKFLETLIKLTSPPPVEAAEAKVPQTIKPFIFGQSSEKFPKPVAVLRPSIKDKESHQNNAPANVQRVLQKSNATRPQVPTNNVEKPRPMAPSIRENISPEELRRWTEEDLQKRSNELRKLLSQSESKERLSQQPAKSNPTKPKCQSPISSGISNGSSEVDEKSNDSARSFESKKLPFAPDYELVDTRKRRSRNDSRSRRRTSRSSDRDYDSRSRNRHPKSSDSDYSTNSSNESKHKKKREYSSSSSTSDKPHRRRRKSTVTITVEEYQELMRRQQLTSEMPLNSEIPIEPGYCDTTVPPNIFCPYLPAGCNPGFASYYSPYPSNAELPKYFSGSYNTDNTDDSQRRTLYVGNIERGISKRKLREKFEKYGRIVEVRTNFRENGNNYGFIYFAKERYVERTLIQGAKDPKLKQYTLGRGIRKNHLGKFRMPR